MRSGLPTTGGWVDCRLIRQPESGRPVSPILISLSFGQRVFHLRLLCLAGGRGVGFELHHNGGALVGLIAVCTGFIAISRDREMLLLAVPIYAYSLFYLASFAANPLTSQSLRYLPAILTFLMFPFLYSSWSISNKATIARCVVMASMVACYAARVSPQSNSTCSECGPRWCGKSDRLCHRHLRGSGPFAGRRVFTGAEMDLAACRSVRGRRFRDALRRLAHWLDRACRGDRLRPLHQPQDHSRQDVPARCRCCGSCHRSPSSSSDSRRSPSEPQHCSTIGASSASTATTTPRLATAPGFGRSALIWRARVPCSAMARNRPET